MIRSLLVGAVFAGLVLPGAALGADAPTVGNVMTVKRARTHLVLEASVSPNGAPATVHAEFGDTPALGGTTSEAAVPSDPPSTLVSITLNKLKPGKTYYFRVVATNSAGTTRSDVSSARTTTTPPGPKLLKGTEVSFAISTGRNAGYPWRLLAMRLPLGLPAGTQVTLRCHRACHGGGRTTAAPARRQLRFAHAIRITRASVVELLETKPGYVGRVRRFVFRRSGSLLEAFRTLSKCLVGSPARIAACPK